MPLDSTLLKQRCVEAGFDLVGIADAVKPPHYAHYLAWISSGFDASMSYLERFAPYKEHPSHLLEGCKSVLVVGLNYFQKAEQPATGKVSIYAGGRDYHKVVRKKLKEVASWANERYQGLCTRICVDSAPIMERDFAQLAGLGWFGKNTCLINTKRGSFFFIGCLLLNQKFVPDVQSNGGCGTCRACIDACPSGALIFQDGDAVARLDSNRCISYLTIEHRGAFTRDQSTLLNGWMFGCDICQTVCPFNQPRDHHPVRAAETTEPELKRRLGNIDAEWVLTATDEEIRAKIAGTALARAGVGQLRRNAEAVLKTDAAADRKATGDH